MNWFYKIGFGLMALIFIVGMAGQVLAEQTVKTIEVPLGFLPQVNANQVYDLTYNMKTPDRIGEIIAMEIFVTGDFQASTKVFSRITKPGSTNLFAGVPGDWTSPPLSATGYDMAFDFSNLVKQYQWTGGEIKFGIYTNKIALNVRATLKITYVNNPVGTAEVFGTEYIYPIDTDAKMWIQLLRNNKSDFIDSAICHLNIYSPDNTKYLDTVTMDYVDEGIYVYDLLVPSTGGVYPSAAECFYDASQESKNATNFQLTTGVVTSGFYTDTWVVDNTEHKVREDKIGGQSYLEIVYNYSGLTQPLPNLTLGISYFWNGRWPSTGAGFDFVTISWWNWTDSSWNPMPNIIIPQSGAFTVSNTFLHSGGNLTKLGYLSSTGEARVKFNDTLLPDTSNTLFQTDALNVIFEVAGVGVYQQVKGAGEIHVINGENLTDLGANKVWNYNPRNVSVSVNNTAIADAVWSSNSTISSNLLSQIVSAVWNYIGTINSAILSAFSTDNWNYTNRSLTTSVAVTVNNTAIADAVWNDTISPARYTHGIVL